MSGGTGGPPPTQALGRIGCGLGGDGQERQGGTGRQLGPPDHALEGGGGQAQRLGIGREVVSLLKALMLL